MSPFSLLTFYCNGSVSNCLVVFIGNHRGERFTKSKSALPDNSKQAFEFKENQFFSGSPLTLLKTHRAPPHTAYEHCAHRHGTMNQVLKCCSTVLFLE